MTEQDWNESGKQLLKQPLITALLNGNQESPKRITKTQFTQIKKTIQKIFGKENVSPQFMINFEKLAIIWENNNKWFELSIEKNKGQCHLNFARGEQ